MIAELIPRLYDIQGRRTFNPGGWERRFGFRPTAPMGSNLTQPLQTRCRDFTEMRQFLLTCRWQSTAKARRQERWQPPEEFEKTRAGNCVAFALWAWRQLLMMGFAARSVGGKSGKYGGGHAWVAFEKDGKWYLLEPQLRRLGLRMPRLSTLRYHPKVSVAWDGGRILYYDHEDRHGDPSLGELPGLIAEWLVIRPRLWIRLTGCMLALPFAMVRRIQENAFDRLKAW